MLRERWKRKQWTSKNPEDEEPNVFGSLRKKYPLSSCYSLCFTMKSQTWGRLREETNEKNNVSKKSISLTLFSGWWRPPKALVRRRRFSLVFSNKFCCSANFFSKRGRWSRIDSTCLQSFEPLFFSVHRISEWNEKRENLIRIGKLKIYFEVGLKQNCCGVILRSTKDGSLEKNL